MGINVLSLFDGMSCGQIALKRAGIKVDNYFASEIDPYAIKITMKNYPKTIQLGSITEWCTWDIPTPDIVIGGSPCQGFSFAGKGLNFDDPRSKLFLEFHDILKHYKPKQFLLENVIMSAQSNDVISSMLGDLYPECIEQGQLFKAGRLEPIMINSALVSAQNRERLYWSNIQGIEQPQDKGILLKDILESGECDRHKSLCLDANYYKGGSEKNYKEKKRRQMVMSQSENRLMVKESKYKCDNPTPVTADKFPCLRANAGGITRGIGISFCKQVGEADIGGNEYTRRVYSPDGKMRCLNTGTGGNLEPKITEDNITWRKLTCLECERLQTVPEIEKNVIIRICSDHQKNYANVENRNHKLPLSVGNVEKIDLKENALYVAENLNIRNQQIKKPVQYDVLINCGEHNIEILGPKNTLLYASNVGQGSSFSPLNSVAGFVLLSVGVNTIAEKIINSGKVESLQKNNISVTQENGVNVVTIYGKGIMQLAKDAGKDSTILNKLLKSIISGHFTQGNREQIIKTLFSYVVLAIAGCIPIEIQNQNIVTFQIKNKQGYTFGVSNSRRYHALGNGWTCDVIAHIFSFLPDSFKSA